MMQNPPAARIRLLAGVPSQEHPSTSTNRLEDVLVNHCRDTEEGCGDLLELKQEHTSRIGFQNIGGLSATSGSAKDDFLCASITKYDFEMFGIVEVNINWTHLLENDRLYSRSRHWRETCSLIQTHNLKATNRRCNQYGGVAQWTIGKDTNRIAGSGRDEHSLGRWTWVRLNGRNNKSLKILTVYRVATPIGGPFTVYAQQRTALLEGNNERCPRKAFLEDLG